MNSEAQKVEFPGHDGSLLAARLDMPAGPVRAFALFAHCFTCSKDVLAAARIANGLADKGIAVLRFDFTGLGSSEGEFANTSFSSNIADLIAAAAFLRDHHEAPQLLIGHSLGGAAVLAAAGDISEVRAVATIGAPFDAGHVAENFAARIEDIERDGKAEVTLAGRSFTITRQFLDDLRTHDQGRRIAELRRALMIFHAPGDEIVGIDNASAIFTAARHPKSFVSLDGADHLLTRPADAAFVADVLAAWAGRYLTAGADTAAEVATPPHGTLRVSETGKGRFQQDVRVGRHRFIADEPRQFGGLDSGPSPYDLLSAALGACTTMTLRMYAERKGVDLPRLSVDVLHRKVHAEDCVDCGDTAKGRKGYIDRFERRIRPAGELNPDVAEKVIEIADKCPVHRTLSHASAIVTRITDE